MRINPKRTSVRSICGGLNFEGRETVSRIPLIARSFKMQFSVIDDNKVANYDEHHATLGLHRYFSIKGESIV